MNLLNQQWIQPLLFITVFVSMSSHASKLNLNSLALGDALSKLTIFNETISMDTFDVKKDAGLKVDDIPKGNVTKEADEDEDDEGDGDEEGYDCPVPSLTGYVSQYNFSAFMPDDYEEVTESMQKIDIYHQIHSFNDTLALMERLLKYVFKLGKNTEMKELLRYMSMIAFERFALIDVSPECLSELSGVGEGIKNFEVWAMKFMDSFGSIHPVGIFSGRLGSFGDYDQCVGIKSPVRENNRTIYGQYCHIQPYKVTQPLDTYDPNSESILTDSPLYEQVKAIAKKANMENYLTSWQDPVKMVITMMENLNRTVPVFSVCLPAGCKPRDIENLLNQYVYPLTKVPLVVDPLLCDTHPDLKEVKFDNFQKASIIGLTTILCIILLCTIYHFYFIYLIADEPTKIEAKKVETSSLTSETKLGEIVRQQETTIQHGIHEIIIAFSIVKNTQTLLYTEKDDSRFAVVDTLRVLLVYWVFPVMEFNMNNFATPHLIKNYFDSGSLGIALNDRYWFARMPTIWNDGFIFIFGMMLIFQQFNQLKRRGGKFYYFIYIWKRWYRLSVSMAGMLLIIYLYPLSGDGPMWYVNKIGLVDQCKESKGLLSSFLFYSNWNVVFDNYQITGAMPICNYPTWFNSMSTQLYLVAPAIFLPLYYWPRFGMILLGFSILISPMFTILPRILTGYPTYMEVTKYTGIESPIRAVMHYNLNPSMYITSLTFGLLTGYLIKCKPKLHLGGPLSVMAIWLTSLGTVVLACFWQNNFWEFNVVPDTFQVMEWWALSKVAVSFFLSFTCYICCTGRGGILTRLLTIPALRPIAKLSYGILLVRYMAIFWRITSIRHQYDMLFFQTFQFIFFDFLTSLLLAYVLYIMFEAPSMTIMKLFERNPSCLVPNSKSINIKDNNNNKDKSEVPEYEKEHYNKEV